MRALIRMKDATKPITIYTSERKDNRDDAKEIESKAISTPVINLKASSITIAPVIRPKVIKTTRISYDRPAEIVAKVVESLGRRKMTNRDVGIKTFNYYVENEIEE